MDRARVIKAEFLNDGSGKKYFELAGNSNLVKPSSALIATGSLFHEVDTKKIYAYDEYTSEWVEQMTLSEE